MSSCRRSMACSDDHSRATGQSRCLCEVRAALRAERVDQSPPSEPASGLAAPPKFKVHSYDRLAGPPKITVGTAIEFAPGHVFREQVKGDGRFQGCLDVFLKRRM